MWVLVTVVAVLMLPPWFVQSFSIRRLDIRWSSPGRRESPLYEVCLHMSSTYGQYLKGRARENIRLPLLVDISSEPLYDVPLPNAHLPPELTTASLYELKLDVPLHRSVIQDATTSSMNEDGCCYGHVVYKQPNSDDLVGSIGCASEILIGAPSATNNNAEENIDRDDSGPLLVLARGSYRFRVKEIVKSIPYPVAIVDEVLDDELQKEEEEVATDDDEGDIYDTLAPNELVKQIFQCLDKILNTQLEEASIPLTPLQKSILEDSGAVAEQQKFDAEERLAVFQTFTSSLLDIATDEKDRYFVVAMMAGELSNLPSNVRSKMLVTTNGLERLRIVLRELSSILAMDSAKLISKSLSLGGGGEGNDIGLDPESLQKAEDEQKKLQVGTPKLPLWADQIRKGSRVEYWWDEVEGWCLGTVDDDPLKVMDEIILSVKFDDDGSIQKLPLRGDEKARWRPPQENTGMDSAYE